MLEHVAQALATRCCCVRWGAKSRARTESSFMGGVEFAEVVAMDQIMLGDSHRSAHSEFRNIYNS